MVSQTIEMKFNELSNKLINRLGLYISLIKNNIDNRKNHEIKTVDSSIQNKELVFCFDLPFAILSLNSYLDNKSMTIISSVVEINKYKLLNIKSLDFIYAFMKLEILII